MTPDEALEAFAKAGHDLPRAAMEWALGHWDEAAPRFVELLGRYASGADRSEAAREALFFVIHLLGDSGEMSAFQPLCRLMHEAEQLEGVLGDAITETLGQILIGTFDGDLAALKGVIDDDAADEFARAAALDALAYLTRAGRQSDEAMRGHLLELREKIASDLDSYVWAGWIMAVARLGYEDLAPIAEEAIRQDAALCFTDVESFREDLARTRDDPDRMVGFVEDGIGPFIDAIGTLERWDGFSGAPQEDDADEDRYLADDEESLDADYDGAPLVPVVTHVNPLRHVGRNDPCPCGSGKKYKKCCLGKSPA